jgi:hypothetical protein
MEYARKIPTVLTLAVGWLVLVGMVGWSTLAIYYSNLPPIIREICSVGFVAAAVVVLARVRPWRRTAAVLLAGFGLVLSWWLAIPARNDRNWQPDVAVLPYATLDGDLVTVHSIRNFNYRSETDVTPAYYDKTFNLRQLDTVDLYAIYWMGPHIAHTILSFGFGEKDHLAVSIETRKEQGEGYSTIKGFFKQYELFYVVADERDVIRVRTTYRHPTEDVYLYRLLGSPEDGRRLFLEYMKRINALKERPEFYNTLTTNCTTAIWVNAQVIPGPLPFSWKLLLSGHVPEYLYERGLLDRSVPFVELRKRSWINARARAADGGEDFSERIRTDSGVVRAPD